MNPTKLALALALTLAACDHEPRSTGDAARDRWSQVQPQARARVAELRSKQTVVAGRVGALALPPGVTAPEIAAVFADLQARVAQLEAPLAALETDTAAIAADVEAAFGVNDRPRARRTVEAAEARLAAAAARAEAAFADLDARVPAAESALQQIQTRLNTEQARFANLAATGGTLELTTVAFRDFAGSELALENVESKAALDRLVQMTGACPQLRVTLSVHLARPDPLQARALGLARAEAVRAYLAGAGVRSEILSLAPAPTPTQAMPDALLVTVTTPCASPAAAPPGPLPVVQPPRPTAERPAAPGHEGHGH